MQTWSPPGGEPISGAATAEPSWDQPGGLGIRERRSWASWQLASAGIIFLLLGMMVGYSGKKPPKAGGTGGTAPAVSLSGSSDSSSATATTVQGLAPGPQPTSTTVAEATTAAPAGVSGAAACNAPKGTLMPNSTGHGPADLQAFSPTGPWCLGWVFSCVLAPGGSGPFLVTVVQGTTAGSPVVQATSRTEQGQTGLTTTGLIHLHVATDPGCRWAIKATSS